MFLDNGGLVAGFAIFKPEIILITAKNIISAEDCSGVGQTFVLTFHKSRVY